MLIKQPGDILPNDNKERKIVDFYTLFFPPLFFLPIVSFFLNSIFPQIPKSQKKIMERSTDVFSWFG